MGYINKIYGRVMRPRTNVMSETLVSSIFFLIVICVPLLGLTTEAYGQAGESHRHRLHHGDDQLRPRRGREVEVPIYQSYVSDSRVTDGSIVPLRAEAVHQNLHKPDFKECSSYRPQIPEGQPSGTSVIQVTAVDDDPLDYGGTVTYSIVSRDEAQDQFVIDAQTGWIITRKIFDRDEPAKEKEVYVTVRATDNGMPQLDAVCTMKVQITDINDNTAQFLLSRRFNQGSYVPAHEWNPSLDKYEYKESMPQDLAIGQVVMRISATDIDDGNNGTVIYRIEPHPNIPNDIEYFQISPSSGEISLKKRIEEGRRQFQLRIVASDMGKPPLSAMTDLSIIVVEPLKRPPEFLSPPTQISLDEYTVDLARPVATVSARSNTDDDLVFFELVNGQTQPTNKEAIFTLETEGKNTAHLKLDRRLDYESVSKYILTIRATNQYELAAETVLTVLVNDQNDEKPYFTEVTTGTVLENEPKGTSVMRVRAIDTDGTVPFNEVTYYLKEEDKENFNIDTVTGEITTRKEFDREQKNIYQLTVYARDGAPSVIVNNGPNERPATLKIVIEDKNDNKPEFVKPLYEAEMSENADLKENNVVVEVRAKDEDTASQITYTITEGNVGDAFSITSTSTSGIISVKNKLDYETVRQYELTVRASDSLYEATTKVRINIQNVNDAIPTFEHMESEKTIYEESVSSESECIFTVKAFDPDIGDRRVPQNISFYISKGIEHFSVGREDGCVKVIKPLDRDAPNGHSSWQVYVGASDEWGIAPSLTAYKELTVNLIDINDNAPVLSSPNPVVWNENQLRGSITQLNATDNDGPDNGAPFTFAIDASADSDIKNLFSIEGTTLKAGKDNFDREERSQYVIPIAITDSGNKKGISSLTVIIGDENDNPMKDGESKIFVYKYKGESTYTIGRVFVEDPDDWDLPYKTFEFDGRAPNYFTVDSDTGSINMKPSTEAGVYNLTFKVTDNQRNERANGKVTVTVKQITDEAVDNSGSIRFMGTTKEQFIKPDKTGRSRKDKLHQELAARFGVPLENVDIFTVGNSPSNPDVNVFDVRFSAHASPYWKAEKLNGLLAESKEVLEKILQLNIVMIGIDECMKEKYFCESSCTNNLAKMEIPYTIFTNTTSFVGVHAFVDPVCTCASAQLPNSCLPNPCLNNGICQSGGGREGFECECKAEFEGPRCEITSISLDGAGYAWYPPLTVCNDSELQVQFRTLTKNGLILYNGPASAMSVTDFISLELKDGKPLLLLDYGSGVSKLEITSSPNLGDGSSHKIWITWRSNEIALRVDECRRNEGSCFRTARPVGNNSQLNVNGPLQLGGISFNPSNIQSVMKWSSIPTKEKFLGCVANLTFNKQFYNLGDPSYVTLNVTNCDSPTVGVYVATLGVDVNFIIILLVCILILLLLVIAIVFYRRRRSYEEVKGELGDDVRENIINYSDEGGGEGDQTGYDLSVLMKPANSYITSPTDKIPMDNLHPVGRAPDNGEGPDIQSFLQGNKNKVDNDPDGLPYDDVRNYAYEGDGNSMGSLSSLASGTDDGDLNFDYLPTFGPRFKKLADMYGGNSSDEDSYTPPPEAWC